MFIQSSTVNIQNLSDGEVDWIESIEPDYFVEIEGDDVQPRSVDTSETWEAGEFDNPEFRGQHVVFANDHPQAEALKRLGTVQKGFWNGETLVTIESVSADDPGEYPNA